MDEWIEACEIIKRIAKPEFIYIFKFNEILTCRSYYLQEENLTLRRQKVKSGEPYTWADYMSLTFTHHVRNL